MRIGIDVSQTVYPQGVGRLTTQLVTHLISQDTKNHYVLFFSSLRGQLPLGIKELERFSHVTIKRFPFPPTLLHLLWNVLHIIPVEYLIGRVDVFLSSDWTQPPTRSAKKVSIIHDLSIYLYPEQAHDKTRFSLTSFAPIADIVAVQKKRLHWVVKECNIIVVVSVSTKKDVIRFLQVPEERLRVIYEGIGT